MNRKFLKALICGITITSISFSGMSGIARAMEPNVSKGEVNPEFIQYLQEISQNEKTDIKNQEGKQIQDRNGIIPSPIKIKKIPSKNLIGKTQASFPAKYDLRELGRVTSVKDQMQIGSCWTFGANASLESCVLSKEKVGYDYSENNILTQCGNDLGKNKGGNMYIATSYFAKWAGPVLESQDPYSATGTIAGIVNRPGIPPQKHIQDVYWVPSKENPLDNNDIKSMITEYGAVNSSISFADGAEGDKYNFFNPKTNAFYDFVPASDAHRTNHAVVICGWDDNYPKENFKSYEVGKAGEIKLPAGNGAYICKNSWGTTWGDAGYYYVSYYDTFTGMYNSCFPNFETVDNYSKMYCYDPTSATHNYGFKSPTAWFSNVFNSDADKNETLKAVSFYTEVKGSKYEVYLQKDYNKSKFEDLVKISEGTLDMPGYRTIKLDKPVQLENNKKFAVVVKLTQEGLEDPILVEAKVDGYSSKASANPGESFISADGTTWKDLTTVDAETKNANVCLKAFTSIESQDQAELSVKLINPTDNKALKANRDANLTVRINNNSSASKKATLVVALYDKNNEFIKYAAISQDINSKDSADLTSKFNLPENAKKVKCFIWDNLETMKLIGDPIEISVE